MRALATLWALWALCALWALWALRAAASAREARPHSPACGEPDPEHCPASAGPLPPCCANPSSGNDYSFCIHSRRPNFNIIYAFSAVITLRCSYNMSLDSDALPRFASIERVRRVVVVDCMPPDRSYGAALAALRVQLLPPAPRLDLALPAGALLRPHHLTGLPPLHSLKLSGYPGAAVEAGLFTAPSVRNLTKLSVQYVPLRAADLHDLPPQLQALYLTSTGGDAGVTLTLPPSLKDLSVRNERLVTVNLTDTKNLESLIISRWNESHPNRWLGSKCPQLHSLVIEESLVQQLPARWVSACGSLQKLHLRAGRLRELPARLLAGARCLRSLTLTHCSLRRLPADLLDGTIDLFKLILSDNRLLVLPKDFFKNSVSLREVDLSGNQLVSWSSLAASGLTSLAALDTLHLERNPLDDPCAGSADDSSPLKNAHSLKLLNLKNTNLTHVCRDWRALPLLRTMELQYNRISRLTYADLQFDRRQTSMVYLQDNPIENVTIAPDEYHELLKRNGSDIVIVQTNAIVACDCTVYYLARALREGALPARVEGLRCRAGPPLRAAPPARLTCAARPCPPHCACRRRPGWLRARCTHPAALPDLPADLTELDLRNDSIEWLSAAETSAILAASRVWLAGNPLRCDCRNDAALRLLRAHGDQIQDYDQLKCPNGRPLGPVGGCSWGRGGAAAGASLALLAAVAALCAASPTLRARLEATLARRARPPDPGADCPYDAFVSFSHRDERFVAEMVARLESGPRPYRLCVHQRDWVPGEWIPAQIEASVRASRRTIAVVSEHFLRSAWARAEVRAALEAGRLVVVLLCAPGEVTDPALAAHLTAHTYVAHSDRWFWRKLRRALPPPRPPLPIARVSVLPRENAPGGVKLLSVTYSNDERPVTPAPTLKAH